MAGTNEIQTGKIRAEEYYKLINLVEAIYVNAVVDQVNRLCKKYCFGCEMNHCDPIYHDCITMGDRQRWFNYSGLAVKHVNEEGQIWEEFNEALRVLKTRCHIIAFEHLKKLEKTPDMLYILWERYNQAENPELESILRHLQNWRNDCR